MNIGFDLHGTLDKYYNILEPIMRSYMKDDHNVYIISGSEKNELKNELEKIKIKKDIHYNNLISVVNYYRDELKIDGYYKEYKGKQNWYCEDEIWWKSKAIICEKYNIDILIDDSLEYRKHFFNSKTTYILMNDSITETINNLNKLCKINSLILN